MTAIRRALAITLLLAAVPASAAPSPATVTAATFVLRGHGYGHGVGMPQWGAYGYARNGWTYDGILAHFYPGTELAQAPAPKVRILLASGSRLTVASDAPFKLRGAGGIVRDLPAGTYTTGPALAVRSAAGKTFGQLAGPLVFLPGKAPLVLGKAYRGAIEISESGGRLLAVNVVSLDAYVRGVINEEMPSDWPLEALKAQAVATRSYALAMKRDGVFNLYPDTRDQVYGGIAAETAAGNEAVAETRGQVLLYEGKVATTFFYSSSGGRTANYTDLAPNAKPVPYLVAVDDPYDVYSPHHNWGPIVLNAADVSKRLGVRGVTDLKPIPATGRASRVTIVGAAGEKTVPATGIRWGLGLRSTWFTVGLLSLSRPGGTLAPGGTVTLTGIARKAGAAVLQQRAPGGAWTAGPALSAFAPDGTFTVAVSPAATTEYRLVAGGVSSQPLRVPVAAST
jgi:stage II sporulation protein D